MKKNNISIDVDTLTEVIQQALQTILPELVTHVAEGLEAQKEAQQKDNDEA
jgi:hypothetical protein